LTLPLLVVDQLLRAASAAWLLLLLVRPLVLL